MVEFSLLRSSFQLVDYLGNHDKRINELRTDEEASLSLPWSVVLFVTVMARQKK